MRNRSANYISNSLRMVLIGVLRWYQYCISPLLGARCRFHPGCSMYARDAIEQYGAAKGCWLAFKRLIKCHPLHSGGYDPVPDSCIKKQLISDKDKR